MGNATVRRRFSWSRAKTTGPGLDLERVRLVVDDDTVRVFDATGHPVTEFAGVQWETQAKRYLAWHSAGATFTATKQGCGCGGGR